MQEDFIINAEVRSVQGKGASRRLRRENKVPAILYGGGDTPLNLQLDHDEMVHHLEHESFYSHVLTVKVDGKEHQAVLKDVQRHPARALLLHLDLQRVVAGHEIRMSVPVHFVGEGVAPGVKQGGLVDHLVNEVEVVCMPRHLPEYIEVDVSGLEMDHSLHLSDIKLPEGVTLTALQHGDDSAIAVIHKPRAAVETTEESEEGEEAAGEEGAGEE